MGAIRYLPSLMAHTSHARIEFSLTHTSDTLHCRTTYTYIVLGTQSDYERLIPSNELLVRLGRLSSSTPDTLGLGFSGSGSYHLGRHSFLAFSRKTKKPDAKREPREEAVRACRASHYGIPPLRFSEYQNACVTVKGQRTVTLPRSCA